MTQRNDHARRVLELAREEAERFEHRYLGPEHLMLGVLRDGSSGAGMVLDAAALPPLPALEPSPSASSTPSPGTP